MEIEVKKVEKFFVGEKEFPTELDAENYVRLLNEDLQRTYYLISCEPDLTEGRGYYNKIIVSVPGNNMNSLFQYLTERYGAPIVMVQGVSPINNYTIGDKIVFNTIEEVTEFEKKERRVLGERFLVPQHIRLDLYGNETN